MAAEDEQLRQDLETQHVTTFQQRTRVSIFRYLKTTQGQSEIDLVIKEIEAIHAEDAQAMKGSKLDPDEEVVPPEMKKKANIYEIFRKYDEDGSDSIDGDEIRILLKDLGVKMKEKEIDELIDRLDTDGGGEGATS